jgi:hemolysin activation/secretion protein
MQGYTRNVFQNPPFLRLSQLGGKRMLRGYFEGAYQDERYMAFQGEYRWMFSKHFGFTVFGALGGVSPHIREVLDDPRYAYGGGFRFRFNTKEKISARFDYGVGKNTSNFYFTIGEAF